MPKLELLFLLLQSIVAIVFVYYGVTKLFMPRGIFEEAIRAYRLFPQPIPRYLAQSLPYLEILLGTLLLLHVAPFIILVSSLFLLGSFQVAVGSALVRKLHIGCGCGGQQENAYATLKQAFLRNWLLIALQIVALVIQSRIALQTLPRILSLILPFIILGATLLAAVASGIFSQRRVVTGGMVPQVASPSNLMNRRNIVSTSVKVAVSLFSLPLLSQIASGTAFACIPTDSGYCIPAGCDCNCIMYMVTTAPDCNTYCGNCELAPCYAPIYMKTAYYCCGKAKTPCDISLKFDSNYKCY